MTADRTPNGLISPEDVGDLQYFVFSLPVVVSRVDATVRVEDAQARYDLFRGIVIREFAVDGPATYRGLRTRLATIFREFAAELEKPA